MGRGAYDEIDTAADPRDYQRLTISVIAVEIIGLLMTIMAGIWMSSYYDGFGWDIKTVFNYHPLFMTLGLIYLYGNAILLYRVLRNVTKIYVKILHALTHVGAFIFAAVALKAVFDSHNKAVKPIPNLYSLHSWVGLSTVILFCLQWILGFVSFLYPKLSDALRRMFLPHHKFWGLTIFVMACAAALMGITEKALFSLKPPNKPAYSDLPGEAVLLNCFGMSILIFGILVVYLVTKHEYHRPPEHEMIN